MMIPPLAVYESLKAIRYFAGLRQTAMAEILGMTQGWLSKCEAGVGDITVDHLIRLKKEFGISSDCIIDGNIPYLKIAERYDFQPRIPARYCDKAGTSIRLTYGFLNHYRKRLGNDKVEALWKKLGFAEELLAEPSFPVHIRLLVDLVEFGAQEKLLVHQRDWQDVVDFNLSSNLAGAEHRLVQNCRSPEEFFKRFLDISNFFTRDLGYAIKKSGKKNVQIAVRESTELSKIGQEDSAAVQRFVTSYSRALIRRTADRICNTNINVKDAVISAKAHGGARKEYSYHVSW